MTLAQIDELLLAWNGRLATFAASLLALQADPTYKRLGGTSGAAAQLLAGSTQARIAPALRLMADIFEQFDLLHAKVEQAAGLRAPLPVLFGGEAKIREIEGLLTGDSIRLRAPDLPSEGRPIVAARPEGERVSLETLFGRMGDAFAEVREAVSAMSLAAQACADAFANLEGERDRLKAGLADLRNVLPASLHEVDLKLAALKVRAATDPLGVQAELTAQVRPMLADLQSHWDAAAALHRGVLEARIELECLYNLRHESQRAYDEARAKVTGGELLPKPTPPGKLDALSEWLDRLDHRRAGSELGPLAVGLRQWNGAAQAHADEIQEVCRAAKAPLERRMELRGRFDALKAKARVHGVAEEKDAVLLAAEAEAFLFTRPTDLREAEAALARYERALTLARKGVLRP